MAIDFPTGVSSGYIHTDSITGRSWMWNGSAWDARTAYGPQGLQGTQGVQGTQGLQGLQGTAFSTQSTTAAATYYPTFVDSNNAVVTAESGYTNANLTYNPSTGILSVPDIALTTGQVSLTEGGTNASLTANIGGIVYSTASAMAILSGNATAGKHLQSGASAAPSWTTATFPSTATSAGTILRADGTNWVATTATYPATTTLNQILYSSSANVIGGITAGTANQVLRIPGAGGAPAFGQVDISQSAAITGTLGTGNGGTGLTTFTAANNAIYSTSSSALAAGTLPVLAGGTGVTTSTGSGNNVLSASPSLTGTIGLGNNVIGDDVIEIGGNRTSNGLVFIDFHTTVGSDYESRIIRNTGANGTLDIAQTGTGAINFVHGGTTKVSIASSGSLSVSSSSGDAGSFISTNTNNYAMTLYGTGGSSYGNILFMQNQAAGATNTNKVLRLNPTGGLELINSAYTNINATFFDNGNFSISGTLTAPSYTATSTYVSASPANQTTVNSHVPTGCIMPFAGSIGAITSGSGQGVPTGWLVCNGDSISTTTYSALFAVIGYTYGGSGASFNLPNLSGRVPVGVGTATGAAGATAHTLAQSAGEELHTMTTAEMPSHNHSGSYVKLFTDTWFQSGGANTAIDNDGTGGSTQNYTLTMTANGSNTPFNIMQPYLTLYYIIKY